MIFFEPKKKLSTAAFSLDLDFVFDIKNTLLQITEDQF